MFYFFLNVIPPPLPLVLLNEYRGSFSLKVSSKFQFQYIHCLIYSDSTYFQNIFLKDILHEYYKFV